MLSDEEREALEILKAVGIRCKGINIDEVIINLIEKQSKEIEEYKKQLDLDYVDKHYVPIERYNQLEKEIEELKEENEKYKNPPFFDEEKYISKEESEQKEKQAWIEGTNVADKLCNKKWEEKIKAKIEEEDKLFFKTKDVRHANRYKAYKELLEKE